MDHIFDVIINGSNGILVISSDTRMLMLQYSDNEIRIRDSDPTLIFSNNQVIYKWLDDEYDIRVIKNKDIKTIRKLYNFWF